MPFVQPWLEVDFGSAYGALGTVGYRLYQANGTDSVARTTVGVQDISGNGAYGVASVTVPDNAVGIEWDTGGGSPVYAVEDIEPYRDRDALPTAAAIATDVWSEPVPGAFGVGEAGRVLGDNLNATVSSRATQAQILSDATPFAGADVTAILADTAAIDARLPSDPADESQQQASHAQTQADIAALNDLSQADVQTAMTAQGYTTTRATKLDNLDAPISSVITGQQLTNALLHDNGVVDQQTYDADDNLLTARLRSYDSRANAEAAGSTGLLHTFLITATYTNGRLDSYTLVRVGS